MSSAEIIDKDTYESITFDHDFQKTHIEKALKLVRQYIIVNKLLLVGGMAIDLSLRAKGSKLYPDNKLPDYDFLSSNFHVDAYKLGEQLVKDNIPGISVIRGMHASTMRVRVNFVPVADITYIPENLFKLVPTIEYQGFTIVHPHYQMIDQHRALSLPYENAPFETIMQRFDKDLKRNDLLYEAYPIESEKLTKTEKITVSKDMFKNNCINGFLAAMYWLKYAVDNGYKPDIEYQNILDNTTFEDQIKTELPDQLFISILSDHPDKVALKDGIIYNSTLDKIVCRTVSENYEVLHNHGSLTSAYYDKTQDLYVANLQSVLCHMLATAIIYKNKNAQSVFCLSRDLFIWGCKEYLDSKDEKYLLLLPTHEAYGDHNYTESHELAYKDFESKIDEVNNKQLTPKNAYPEPGKSIKESLFEFVPADSPIYQVDGLPTKKEFLNKE